MEAEGSERETACRERIRDSAVEVDRKRPRPGPCGYPRARTWPKEQGQEALGVRRGLGRDRSRGSRPKNPGKQWVPIHPPTVPQWSPVPS